MIQVGDLVESRSSGKVGIITGLADGFSYRIYYHVLFCDDTYTVHIDNLKPLETK
jgi:hypothetical protein